MKTPAYAYSSCRLQRDIGVKAMSTQRRRRSSVTAGLLLLAQLTSGSLHAVAGVNFKRLPHTLMVPVHHDQEDAS